MTEPLDRARAVLRGSPLVDGHNDLPHALRKRGYDFDAFDIARPQPELMTDIPRLRDGMVGGQFWSVYVPASLQGDGAVTATLEQIDAVHRMVARYPDVFELALTADDVERAFAGGRIASLIGMEGGTIGAEAAMPYTSAILDELRVRHPKMAVEIRLLNFGDQITALTSGDADVAFLRPPVPPKESSFNTSPPSHASRRYAPQTRWPTART